MTTDIVIELWPTDKLVPYERNPRRNDAHVNRMADAIREFGFKIPILARSNGEVVDGHLRLKAAQKLGLERVPVLLCDEWTDVQVKAFRLLANKSASWAEWDDELLSLELSDLRSLDFDLSLTGFDDDEVAKHLNEVESPADFGEYDETISTEHQCPKCGFQWSGANTYRKAVTTE